MTEPKSESLPVALRKAAVVLEYVCDSHPSESRQQRAHTLRTLADKLEELGSTRIIDIHRPKGALSWITERLSP